MNAMEIKLLQRLAEIYPTIAAASTEIINLQSIMNLPKGTEHFITDIHGEYEAFSHVLRNGSGSVKKKIDDVFGHTLSYADKKSLATLIYYPREKMTIIKKKEEHIHDWYKITLYRLIEVCKCVASKYTRSKVRKALPEDFSYIIEELITEKAEILDKGAYYEAIISTIIDIGRAEEFIEALCTLIKRLVVDRLHILGDIYDRGPAPHSIMDRLVRYHSLDIQWGNHDIVWMGAAAGQMACIATVIRNSARYGNLDILEDGYGINMLPLATFAIETYKGDPCESFKIHGKNAYNYSENRVNVKMHKAIAVIQFKLEGQLIKRRPEFHMENRLLLDKVDYEKGTIALDGKNYELLDTNFPTIDPKDPYALTQEEAEIMDRLCAGFVNCKRLQSHMQFLLNKGNLYKVYNGNLMYHGCIPMREDGSFEEMLCDGRRLAGKALMDYISEQIRKAYCLDDNDPGKADARDLMWYLWCGAKSPVFGKDRMTTFEHYFVADKSTHKEHMNPYYQLSQKVEYCDRILKEFGLPVKGSHIINGHVPVKIKDGETPIKANGKLYIIDGGLSKAYQKQTGIAGYTLIYNSHHLALAEHKPFDPEKESTPRVTIVEKMKNRVMVADTDKGVELKECIADLKELVAAYRSGDIKETE